MDFLLPNGTEADFYIKAEAPAAAIFALTGDDRVILARQFRPGPKKILNELPGGYLEPGENALESISREFREETGYEGEFIEIGTCLDDVYSTLERHCFVATNCKKVGEPQDTEPQANGGVWILEHDESMILGLRNVDELDADPGLCDQRKNPEP